MTDYNDINTYFEIIFDNGGGATLQVNVTEYVHNYDDMSQLADDVRALADGADVADWDGNDPDCYISDEDYWKNKQNGGYFALDSDTWQSDYTDHSWRNVRDFSVAIRNDR